jgi:lauroyl/myristoyl acyltransferase
MTRTDTAIPTAPLSRAPAGTRPLAAIAPPRPSPLARCGLHVLFLLARRAPRVLLLLRPLAVTLTIILSPATRRATTVNARGIFGRTLPPAEQRRFTRDVVANFYDFVTDTARAATRTREQLAAQIVEVVGEPAYLAHRSQGRGAILVTAHMGTFEVGLAALRGVEERVHVVFKRDPFTEFEATRARVRKMLGVQEAPIDDGLQNLVRLRDALLADEVVVMQGDRAMPGQRSQIVPLCYGHTRLPTGPVKLAQLTGSPIVPVFVVRTDTGRYTVHLCDPIVVPTDTDDAQDVAMTAIGKSIQSFVARYPQQWLVLEPAFTEDR